MTTKKPVGLGKKQLSPSTTSLLARGFERVHDRKMTSADLEKMQLIDAKQYLKLGDPSSDILSEASSNQHAVTLTPAAEPKKRLRKTRVVLVTAAALALIGIIGSSVASDTETVTPAAKSESVVPIAENEEVTIPAESEIVAPAAIEPVPAPAPQPVPIPKPAPVPTPSPSTNADCDPNYSGGCVPNVPYDLNCPDIGFTVQVIGTDRHRFDRDKDGVGCE